MARLPLLFILWAAVSPLGALEGHPALQEPLTLVFEAETPVPQESLAAMKLELDRLFARSGVQVELRDRKQVPAGFEASDLVLVRLKGACSAPANPLLFDERDPGAYAYTHITDGDILSFSEVLCDRVWRATKRAMWGGEHARSGLLFGRALARVVAHEVMHILAKDRGHSRSGVFQRALSGRQLITEELDFEEDDHTRLREAAGGQ